MKSRFVLAFGLALALACSASAALAAEVQVAFDPAGRIQRVDEALARRIGMFVAEHPGFQEARLFAVDDTSFVLEISAIRGGRLERERVPMTLAQVEALRAEVAGKVAASGPAPAKLNQDGRTMLVAGYALMGLGFYGWALPYMTDVQDGSAALGEYLLVSGASAFAPMLMTQNAPVSWAATNLSLFGATRGIWHGSLVYDLFSSGNSGWGGDEGRGRVGVMMVTSLAEGALGYAAARAGNMDGGTAQTVVNGGDYGLAWGVCASELAGCYDRDDDRAAAAMTLAGAAAGTLGSRWLAANRAYSYGDAWVMRSAGYVGGLLGATVADLGNPDDSKPYAAGVLAGTLAGLAVGDRLVKGREFTGGDGILVQLGGSAGALMGLGLVALSSPDGDGASALWWSGGSLGATLGWALTWNALSSRAAARAAERTSWRFGLEPAGVLAALASSRAGARAGASPAPRARAVPVALRVSRGF